MGLRRSPRHCRYSLQVRRQHHRRRVHGALLDLPAEAKHGVLLEALLDVEDVLVLQCDEAHLLQPAAACLLNQPHHRLGGGEKKEILSLFKTLEGYFDSPVCTALHMHALVCW